MVPTETDLERDILRYLELRGICAWSTHSGKRKPVALGVPDIIGAARDGRMIAIEVKAPDGIVSERQEEFHLRLFRNRVRVIVARSLGDVISALDDKVVSMEPSGVRKGGVNPMRDTPRPDIAPRPQR